MAASPVATSAESGGVTGARAWLALAVLTLPVLLVSVDNTVLGFAVPVLSEQLRPSATQLLWVVDVYSFVLAGLLVTMGVLGDRIGRRRLLLLGSAGFGLASLLAAYSSSAEVLIVARALMGLAGATLMPATLSLIRNIFTDRARRRTAIAIWASAFSGGAALGPIVGGWLLEHFWWGSVFLLNLPIMLLLLVVGPWLIPESRDPAPGRFDPLSVLYSLLAMLPAVYGVKKLAEAGFALPPLVAASIGLTFGVLFVRRQRRLTAPLLDVTLFAERRFTVAVVTNLLAIFVMVGTLFFLTQHLQLVLDLRPMHAGLLLLPGLALTVAGSLLGARLLHRIRPSTLLGLFLTVAAFGAALTSTLSPSSGVLLPVAAFACLGLGIGVAELVTNDAILAAVPARRAGAASAVSETAYELGAALGTAVLGSVLSAVYRGGLDEVPGVAAEATAAARETLGSAMSIAADLGGPAGAALADAAEAAFGNGVTVTAAIGAVLMAATAVQAWLLLRRMPHSPDEASDQDPIEAEPVESGRATDVHPSSGSTGVDSTHTR